MHETTHLQHPRLAKRLARALLPRSLVVFRGPASLGRIALTFDDGPGPLTSAYLDVLERVGARATFFVVGTQCEKHPELLDEIAARGHELGVHGYTHKRFSQIPASILAAQELFPTEAFFRHLRQENRLVRPPHGDLSVGALLASRRAGFTTVLWSRDSEDWRTRSGERILACTAPEVVDAGAIVLLHEGQSWTLAVLEPMVRRLQEKGHELVSVGQLLDG